MTFFFQSTKFLPRQHFVPSYKSMTQKLLGLQTTWYDTETYNSENNNQGSTKVPSGRPGQVDFEVRQVTFQGHLPDGQAFGQTLYQITF